MENLWELTVAVLIEDERGMEQILPPLREEEQAVSIEVWAQNPDTDELERV